MGEKIISKLIESDRSYLIAPAGCGKTETIVRAVQMDNSGRQLILTHTHAGVRSIRRRFNKYKVSTSKYYVDSIAGLALRIASSYPGLSSLKSFNPMEDEWDLVYSAAIKALDFRTIKELISNSFTGIYVDEYQDCTVLQHKLVLLLSDILPCRLLGDPLQGIFDFGGNEPINWKENVDNEFDRLPDLNVPWRWIDKNQELSDWLIKIRPKLIEGEQININNYYSGKPEFMLQRKSCIDQLRKEGSIVAIHKFPTPAHKFSKNLGGLYKSMEENECKDLLNWANTYGEAEPFDKAMELFNISSLCFSNVQTEFKTILTKINNKEVSIGSVNIPNLVPGRSGESRPERCKLIWG